MILVTNICHRGMIVKSTFSCKGTTKCLRNLRKEDTNKDRQALSLSITGIFVLLLNFSEEMKINFKKKKKTLLQLIHTSVRTVVKGTCQSTGSVFPFLLVRKMMVELYIQGHLRLDLMK